MAGLHERPYLWPCADRRLLDTVVEARQESGDTMAKAAAARKRTTPPWTALADTLLLREASACRSTRGGVIDPLAGLRIDDDTADRAIDALAQSGDGTAGSEARAAFDEAVDQA